MSVPTRRFRLAPMSPLIWFLTLILLALPVVLLAVGRGKWLLGAPALLVIAIYGWVWLRFRPSSFMVHPGSLEVVWPLKRRQIRRESITSVRLIEGRALRRELGWCMRIGAGGLWGAFGWLWTQRRGMVQMYISRTDGFVWIERGAERPWLITPEQPQAFVSALSS
ncbi:MAG TPA: PH domain-containing protein [Gemmatimonadota bacterium]